MRSETEHAIAASVMFSRMDRDGDEAVTVEEMDAEREALLDKAPADTAQRLAQVDGNGDGRLDEAEHEASTRAMFDRYDGDGDGRMVEEEFAAATAELQAAN